MHLHQVLSYFILLSLSKPALIGKRTEGSHCSVCCKKDHCNVNACGHNHTGQIFQLKSVSPGTSCTESNPALCAALGRLNADACKEASVKTKCPKSCMICGHIGWNSWQPWSSCSTTCNAGTMTRSRDCKRHFSIVGNQPCVGSSVETKACLLRHCPENGNWCHKTVRNCRPGYEYSDSYCSIYTQKTTCDCPTPKYGGTCVG